MIAKLMVSTFLLLCSRSHAQTSTLMISPAPDSTNPVAAAPQVPVELNRPPHDLQEPAVLPPVPSPALPAPVLAPATPLPSGPWSPKLLWTGDLRYRLAKSHEADDEDRNFQALRVRLGLKADVNEETLAVVRLASGSSAVSGNQTLGDPSDPGMPRRNFGIDLAYLDWTFQPDSHVWAGRTTNPFWAPAKVRLIYAGDLAFEGIAFRTERKSASPWSSFFNAGAFMISENYAAPDDVVDTGLAALEGGVSFKSASAGTLTAHVGQHHYVNLQDKIVSTLDKNAKIDPYSYPFERYKGNTVYPDNPLAPAATRKDFFRNQYILNEMGLEWKMKSDAADLTVFYDTVTNSQVADQKSGTEWGVLLKRGRVQVGYAQATKEADCVVGTFTDPDTNGGGTDNRGNRLSLSYELGKNSQLTLNDYRAKRGVDTVERNFSRTDLEVLVTF